jgi:hypothetical protein
LVRLCLDTIGHAGDFLVITESFSDVAGEHLGEIFAEGLTAAIKRSDREELAGIGAADAVVGDVSAVLAAHGI